jgi:hypothetical protein
MALRSLQHKIPVIPLDRVDRPRRRGLSDAPSYQRLNEPLLARDTDDGDPAKGIGVGLVLGISMWALVGAGLWILYHIH